MKLTYRPIKVSNFPIFIIIIQKKPQINGSRPACGIAILINNRFIHLPIHVTTLTVENTTVHNEQNSTISDSI